MTTDYDALWTVLEKWNYGVGYFLDGYFPEQVARHFERDDEAFFALTKQLVDACEEHPTWNIDPVWFRVLERKVKALPTSGLSLVDADFGPDSPDPRIGPRPCKHELAEAARNALIQFERLYSRVRKACLRKLTPRQLEAAAYVREHPGCIAKEIAGELNFNASYVRRLLMDGGPLHSFVKMVPGKYGYYPSKRNTPGARKGWSGHAFLAFAYVGRAPNPDDARTD